MAETRLPKQKITNDMSTSASRASRRPPSSATTRSSSRSRPPSRARRRRRSGSSSSERERERDSERALRCARDDGMSHDARARPRPLRYRWSNVGRTECVGGRVSSAELTTRIGTGRFGSARAPSAVEACQTVGLCGAAACRGHRCRSRVRCRKGASSRELRVDQAQIRETYQ